MTKKQISLTASGRPEEMKDTVASKDVREKFNPTPANHPPTQIHPNHQSASQEMGLTKGILKIKVVNKHRYGGTRSVPIGASW